MRRSKRFVSLALATAAIVLGASACTTTTTRPDVDVAAVAEEAEIQRVMVLEQELRYQRRLSRVGYPILRAAVPLCDDRVRPRIGINISNVHAFDRDYQNAARKVLGVDGQIQLIDVTPGSAAFRAGLETGDRLLEINGQAVPAGSKAVPETQDMLDDATARDRHVKLLVLRGEEALSFEVAADDICYYPVRLAQSDALNAWADGKNIYIAKGMLRFATDDRDLAVIIAHELAHNAMGHIQKMQGNYLLGTLLDIAAMAAGVDTENLFGEMAVRAYSQEFEAEADYVAVYFLALADVDYHGVSTIWRRMVVEHPESLEGGYLSTHPSTAERFVTLERTAEEIDGKIARGEPVRPNVG
jgi:hypothetical protein